MTDLWGYGVRTANTDWYHASPYDLPVGTVLTPGGGKSPFGYLHDRDPDLRNHVWVADANNIGGWLGRGSGGIATQHVYRVEPHAEPRLYDERDPHMGWVAPSAQIVEKIPTHAVPEYNPFEDEDTDGHHIAGIGLPGPGERTAMPAPKFPDFGHQLATAPNKIYRGLEIEPGEDIWDSIHGSEKHSGRVGPHWSTSRGVAEEFAGPYGVVIEADHPGEEWVSRDNFWGDPKEYAYEHEVPLEHNAPLNITSITHRGRELLNQPRRTMAGIGVPGPGERTAMPTPLPEDVTFHYHDTPDLIPNEPGFEVPMFGAPAVEARRGGEYVGHLYWSPESKRISEVRVLEPHQHQSIATALFDHARQIEPELRHSAHLSPKGRAWRDYEESRPRKARTMTAAVTVYTKPSCVQCDMTHKLLDRLGIEHTTVDVTTDPDAHAYVTGLGYQAAPVVVVNDGERHWGGFSPDKLRGLVS